MTKSERKKNEKATGAWFISIKKTHGKKKLSAAKRKTRQAIALALLKTRGE